MDYVKRHKKWFAGILVLIIIGFGYTQFSDKWAFLFKGQRGGTMVNFYLDTESLKVEHDIKNNQTIIECLVKYEYIDKEMTVQFIYWVKDNSPYTRYMVESAVVYDKNGKVITRNPSSSMLYEAETPDYLVSGTNEGDIFLHVSQYILKNKKS